MRLVYKKPDGTLRIVIPVNPNQTIQEIKARVESTNADLNDCVFVGEFEDDQFPQDRGFRDQWRLNAQGILHVDPVLETEERWRRVRRDRDSRLLESDAAFIKATDLNSKVNEWKAYRQALRDITTQSDPKNIVWPVKPE